MAKKRKLSKRKNIKNWVKGQGTKLANKDNTGTLRKGTILT